MSHVYVLCRHQWLGDDGEMWYVISGFTNHRWVKGSLHFNVLWVGWPDPTWQSVQSLMRDIGPANMTEFVHEYATAKGLPPTFVQKAIKQGKKAGRR